MKNFKEDGKENHSKFCREKCYFERGWRRNKKKKKKGEKPPTKIGTTLLEAGNRRRNGEIISHIAQSGRNYVDNGRARVNTRPSKNVCREYPGFDRGLLPPSRGEKRRGKKKKRITLALKTRNEIVTVNPLDENFIANRYCPTLRPPFHDRYEC